MTTAANLIDRAMRMLGQLQGGSTSSTQEYTDGLTSLNAMLGTWNNPRQAILQFVKEDPRFAINEPSSPFDEGIAGRSVTYWPDGYVRRIA